MEPGGAEIVISRPFRAGPLDFAIGSADPAIIKVAEILFGDLPTPASATDLPCFVLTPSAASPSSPPRYDLSGPVVGTMPDLRLPTALTRIVAAVSRASLDVDPERLHLHAAGAVRSGMAVVLAGARESGKTTTVARLALRGWECISDEALSINAGDQLIRGFAKPLSIKPEGRHVLPELAPHLLPAEDVTADDVLHVPVGALGREPVPEGMPRLVAFLRRPSQPPDDLATMQSIHPVDAVVRLMGETMDAERYGRGAVVELARLAARCRCIDLVVGEVDSTGRLIESVFDEPSVTAVAVEELVGGERIAPNVISVRVDDRVVIHELPGGRVLALDPAASKVWLTLGGWADEVDLDGPVIAPFVSQLRSMHLVDVGSPT